MRSTERFDLDYRIPNQIKYLDVYMAYCVRSWYICIITVIHSYILYSNNTQQIFKTCQKLEQTCYYATQLGDTPARITCQPRPCSTCSLVHPLHHFSTLLSSFSHKFKMSFFMYQTGFKQWLTV